MAQKRHKKILSYTLLTLAILVVIGSCASYFVSRHYRRIIIDHLPEWTAAATDSLYRISVGDISINILNRRVKVRDVHIYPDARHLERLKREGRAPAITFDINVPRIRVQGVLWEDLVLDKELSCSQFLIMNPRIRVHNELHRDTLAAAPPPAPKKTSGTMALDRLFARHLELRSPEIAYLHYGLQDTFYCTTQNGTITFDDWELKPQGHNDPTRFLLGDKAHVALASFFFYKPGSLYLMRSDSLVFVNTDSSCRFRNLEIKPVVHPDSFARRVGYQKDRYELLIDNCSLERLHWSALIDGRSLRATVLRLVKPDVRIYMDRTVRPSPESKLGRFPHQLLLRLPLPIYIDSAVMTRGKFAYTELSDKTRREGEVVFDDIDGRISNITNMKQVIRQSPQAQAVFKAFFMHSSPLDATFTFRLSDSSGAFRLDARLKQLQFYQLREAAKALAMADISSLQVPGLSFRLDGDEQEAHGNFEFLYNNLKIRIQGIDQQTKRMSNRPFLSLLANAVLLYPDNPMKGEPVRRVSIVQARDPYKSFFNLIWKSIFQALAKTALRGDEAMNMVREQQERKAGKAERKAARQERRRLRQERREERGKRKAARVAAKEARRS